jgi:hypothetical protein
MRGTSIFAFVFGLSALALACSSSSKTTSYVSIDAQAFCTKDITTCGDTTSGTIDQCVANVSLVRVSTTCASLIDNATCDDLLTETSTFEMTCFPQCAALGDTCNVDGKTITVCEAETPDGGVGESGSRSLVLDCAAACTQQNLTYSGTCGTSFDGQTSDNPQCWCQ